MAVKKSKLKSLIRRLVQAEVNHSWKGNGDPNDVPRIERTRTIARKRLNDAIDQLYFEQEYPDGR